MSSRGQSQAERSLGAFSVEFCQTMSTVKYRAPPEIGQRSNQFLCLLRIFAVADTMLKPDKLMRDAIHEWLVARERFYAHRRDGVEAYGVADAHLLQVFAVDWPVDDATMFGKAYQSFRAALIATATPA
jgi:hypothetical protein